MDPEPRAEGYHAPLERSASMHVAQVNVVYDPRLDASSLPARYDTLAGWNEALLGAGASRVTVIQRFHHDADFRHRGVDYRLRRDSWPAALPPWVRPRALVEALVAVQPGVVHLNGLHFPGVVSLLRRRLPAEVPVLVQDHAGGPPRRAEPGSLWPGAAAALLRRLWRAGLGAADGFLFTAAAQAEPWLRVGLLSPEQDVYEVPEASRTPRGLPRAQARAATGIVGRPALVWVGRLNANKDPLTVLEAFALALPHVPQATLTMVYHDGDLEAAVRGRISASPELGDRVRLHGPASPDEVAALLSAADLFVLGSHHEGSGYALIEALACGAVPAVTDIPPFRALTGGEAGILWPPGDAAALADALVRLAGGDLCALGEAARRRFEGHLSWSAVARRALLVYEAARRSRSR